MGKTKGLGVDEFVIETAQCAWHVYSMMGAFVTLESIYPPNAAIYAIMEQRGYRQHMDPVLHGTKWYLNFEEVRLNALG